MTGASDASVGAVRKAMPYAEAIVSDAGNPNVAKALVDRVLRSFGLSLAAELAPRRIRVNTITPGPINTPISLKMGLSPEQIAGFGQMAANGPFGRAGEPEEIAAAALYYAADGSRFTTGTELRIDGGISAV
jgi:NAD(P)-dependent dehydrogenase (short-subunit alcohol dehydrogenase family)